MTNNQLTDNKLTAIIESAEAVVSALAGTNDDVHPDNSTAMVRLWDSLNDDDAPPEVVLAMARELQELRKAKDEPVAWTDAEELREARNGSSGYLFSVDGDANKFADPHHKLMLYTAPPAPAVHAGWVMVPVEPTEKMIVEGFESAPDEVFSDPKVWAEYQTMSGCQQAAHRAKLCWAAMLSAAPTAPEQEKI